MTDSLKLHGYFRSSTSYRVRILCGLKNIKIETIDVNLVEGEQKHAVFLALNPQGLVPVLTLPDGTTLTQSPAILDYLDEAYPDNPMHPSDLIERAKVRAMTNLIACDIHPVNNLRILKYLKSKHGQSQENVDIWYRHWVIQGFDALEMLVNDQGYCFGNSITMADVYFIPQMYNAKRFKVDLTPYPRLRKINETCSSLIAFTNAHPDAYS